METSDSVTRRLNLGNPVEFTIRESAEWVVDTTGLDSEIVYHDLPEDNPKRRQPYISRAIIRYEKRV